MKDAENERFRQLQEQRRAKAHCRQAKENTLWCSFPGSAWERFQRWLCHLQTEQAAEPPRTRSQAEPGNEHLSEFALAWRLWAKAVYIEVNGIEKHNIIDVPFYFSIISQKLMIAYLLHW